MRAHIAAGVLFVTLLAVPASDVSAQDVQYETVTKIDFPGGMGTAMRLAARLGGASLESVEKTTIKGRKMRSDSDQTSSIMDLEGRRMILLDHKEKTYVSMTFDEMVAQAQRTVAEAQAAADQRQSSGGADAQASFQFRFAVDDANQREKVAGYDASRFFLTMEAEGEYTVEETGKREQGGTFVVLTDMWTSKDIPVLNARGVFDDASARQYADASAALMQGMAAAFADDPRLQVAFEQSMKEARKMEGIPVRTVTTMVSVAPGHRFDRAAVTDPRPAGPGAAARAGRAALGGLARRAAGGAQQQDAPPADAPTQGVIMSVTSEIRNVSTRSVDASLFEVPAGYREVRLGGM
jgi:hypothetical protein